jgi:hypothetical protein
MRSNERRVNIHVNHDALRAWLNASKAAPRPPSQTANSRTPETRQDEPKK